MKSNQLPKILVNSMPKSGTNLLSRVVELLGYYKFSSNRGIAQKILVKLGIGLPLNLSYGSIDICCKRSRLFWPVFFGCKIPIDVTSPIYVPKKIVARWLKAIPYGHFFECHVPYSKDFAQLIKQFDFKHLLIIRDPRDVLVSFIHYVLKQDGHYLRTDFLNLDKNDRVILSIKGGYAPLCKVNVMGILEAFRLIMKWKQSSNVLMVRFEDLIGIKGGGTIDAQYNCIKEICKYLQIDADDRFITQICENAFNTKSHTFRKGQIGAWRNELTHEQLKVFQENVGTLLNDLGYDLK